MQRIRQSYQHTAAGAGVSCVHPKTFLLHDIPQKTAAPAGSRADHRLGQAQLRGNLPIGIPYHFHLYSRAVRLRQVGESLHQRVIIGDELRRFGKGVPLLDRKSVV